MRVTMNRRRAQALVVLRLMLPALGARVVGTKAGVATVGASKREARLGALEKAGERNPADSILSLLVCCPVCCGPRLVPARFPCQALANCLLKGSPLRRADEPLSTMWEALSRSLTRMRGYTSIVVVALT